MRGNGIDPLAAICELKHPVAELARDYLARGTEWSIDDWFLQRAETYFQDQDAAVDGAFSLENLAYALGSSESRRVRLVSIRPYYFRGFRQLERAINLDADLVTVDGRNSSGKTSLAEAIEWLLSGSIQRREQGDPAEHAGFIANRFRPEGQKTWVECILAVDGATTKIRRDLVKDYGSRKNSHCSSQLFIDGKEAEGPLDVLDEYFVGVAPLLMQHTLRNFVLESPDKRPTYFEKILNIDEISDLIATAQVSNLRQPDFPRPGGGTALADWRQFTQSVGEAGFQTVEQYSRLDRHVLEKNICDDLVRVAVDEYGAKGGSDVESCIMVVNAMQERELKRKFPTLQDFQPKEIIGNSTFVKFSDDSQNGRLQLLEKARTDYLTALESQKDISKANVSIAKALEALRESQLIKDEDPQICPVCEYESVATLTRDRIAKIDSWDPIRVLVEQTKYNFEEAVGECRTAIEDLGSLRRRLVPPSLPDAKIQDIGEIANSDRFVALLSVHTEADRELQTLDRKTSLALTELKQLDPELDFRGTLRDVFSLVSTLQRFAEGYAREYGMFQRYLNKLATSAEDYRARDSWLTIVRNRAELFLDFQWEAAKDKSRKELTVCRDLLKEARQKYLESRREAFNEGITGIWSRLRRDEYSAFGELFIPEPRGKGQKARIEVKAKLNNKSEMQEVHALNVLSESQVNVIGIAAFVTRSKLLGHNVLVFDDPVQSMDDDHFRSFAGDLLSHLCGSGFQVVVLTHNDDFAELMSLSHSDRERRISMEIRHTPRKGINVSEGHRSVSGRMDMSLAYWERGEYDTAWVHLRYAIERLYMLIRMKRGAQPFEWRKWKGRSSGNMWKEAVEKLVLPHFPDIARRLPAIVFMTGGGAHSRQADGETDFRSAVDVICELQSEIRVGD